MWSGMRDLDPDPQDIYIDDEIHDSTETEADDIVSDSDMCDVMSGDMMTDREMMELLEDVNVDDVINRYSMLDLLQKYFSRACSMMLLKDRTQEIHMFKVPYRPFLLVFQGQKRI